MNGFVVNVPAPGVAEQKITSDAFWPEVDPVAVRASHRIDGSITTERLHDVLIESIATVNSELSEYRAARLLEGVAKLADVQAEKVDNTSVKVHRYLRAVGSLAKALLQERYRDMDTTAAGNKKADQLENPIDDLRRDYRWAVSDILGIGRTVVELI